MKYLNLVKLKLASKFELFKLLLSDIFTTPKAAEMTVMQIILFHKNANYAPCNATDYHSVDMYVCI